MNIIIKPFYLHINCLFQYFVLFAYYSHILHVNLKLFYFAKLNITSVKCHLRRTNFHIYSMLILRVFIKFYKTNFSHFTLLEWNLKNCFIKLIKSFIFIINLLILKICNFYEFFVLNNFKQFFLYILWIIITYLCVIPPDFEHLYANKSSIIST